MQAVVTTFIQILCTAFLKPLPDCIYCIQCVTAYPPVKMTASFSPWFLLAVHT